MIEAIQDQWVIAAGVVVLAVTFVVWLYSARRASARKGGAHERPGP